MRAAARNQIVEWQAWGRGGVGFALHELASHRRDFVRTHLIEQFVGECRMVDKVKLCVMLRGKAVSDPEVALSSGVGAPGSAKICRQCRRQVGALGGAG